MVQQRPAPSVRTVCMLLLCFVLAACSSKSTGHQYVLKGKVISVDKSAKQVVVDHQEIPGFMAPMTMPYAVKDAKELDDLAPGDEITGQLVVDNGAATLESIVISKKGDASGTPQSHVHVPKRGEEVPDFTLVNQQGKQIRLHDYRGKSVLLTLIYTQCPFADYCPRMSENFAQIEKSLASQPDLYRKTHLLSISFDPRNDTPEVLRAYGLKYLPNGPQGFQHWDFALPQNKDLVDLVKFFGLFYEKSAQTGEIMHSAVTSIISPSGTVDQWYFGNDWTAADVLKDLQASAGGA
jgi:protein SCO1